LWDAYVLSADLRLREGRGGIGKDGDREDREKEQETKGLRGVGNGVESRGENGMAWGDVWR
jgi:hypothetical protein